MIHTDGTPTYAMRDNASPSDTFGGETLGELGDPLTEPLARLVRRWEPDDEDVWIYLKVAQILEVVRD